MYMLNPVFKKIKHKSPSELFDELYKNDFNLLHLIMYHQSEEIANKYNSKYDTHFSVSDALEIYQRVKFEEGFGKLATCNELHLSLFGENDYNDDWSFEQSLIDLVHYPRLGKRDDNETDLPLFIQFATTDL